MARLNNQMVHVVAWFSGPGFADRSPLFSAPRNDEFAGQVSQLSDTKASLLSHQARPSTVQHYRSTCFNMVATSWLRFATWKFWNNRNDRPVLHVAPTVLPLHLLPSPSLFPLSPRRQGLRTLRMLWIACLQFEMSGDVRSYETVVMIWNVDETIIGKILNNWYILRFHQTNLPGYRQVYLWAKKHARPRYRNSGAFVHGTKFRNFGPIMEQGQMMTREQMMSRWSESIYSYLLYLLHFHHITGRQKGSWFLPLLLLRLLSLLLLLLLVKLYDTFCFRKDWKLQRVRSTWLTMCGQMVVLGSYISYMTSACGAGAVQIWVLWGPWAKASTRDPNFHRWGQGVDKIGPANWWHSTHSTH